MADPQDKVKIPKSAEASLVTSIIEDILQSIIHTEVLALHRSEKLLRMTSAAVIAENAAIAKTSSDSFSLPGGTQKPGLSQNNPSAVRAETAGAVYDHGRILLKGNPLKTTPEVLCGKCRLPRLRYPITGEGSKIPVLHRQYCTLHPFVTKPQHDIYGNPFPIDQPKTKKERENLKRLEKEAQAGREGTVGSQEGGDLRALAPGGKAASYVPWHTCPNCKRSLLITRFAQHAEKCLGIAGRASSRNAMVKMGNGNGTPSINGSRVGTPAPASQDGAERDPVAEIKKKKKSSYIKKADREKMAAQGLMAAPKLKSKLNGVNGIDSGDNSPQKRDRDEDSPEKPRKKIKLSLSRKDSEVSRATVEDDDEGDEEDESADGRKGSIAESVDAG